MLTIGPMNALFMHIWTLILTNSDITRFMKRQIKITMRLLAEDGTSGTVCYRLTYGRKSRDVASTHKVLVSEWDALKGEITDRDADGDRRDFLHDVRLLLDEDVDRLQRIATSFEESGRRWRFDDVVSAFRDRSDSLSAFMGDIITSMVNCGKIRTAEGYRSALNSFMRFRRGHEIDLADISAEMMIRYEAFLRRNGVSKNSSSFYMRIFRAVHNRAIDSGLASANGAFRHVYTGVDKTVKRALPLPMVRRIKEIDLKGCRRTEYARDMFLLSFYLRGMSFVDMSYMRKSDLKRGILTYRRRKTGQALTVKWEKCMQEIVDRYATGDSVYLLPIIDSNSNVDERRQYLNKAHSVNRSLKTIGELLGLSMPLTMYVARHSWASIARSKNVPLSVISAGMGHDSEATTRIYLAELDTVAVDKANSMILRSL